MFLLVISATQLIPVSGLDAIDLAIYPSGYTPELGQYSYSEYVDIMDSWGVERSDFMLVNTPIDMAICAYTQGDILVYIEVFKFETAEQAIQEYNAQRDDRNGGTKLYNGPMFQRFISRDRIFRHENFIALAIFDPYNDVDAMDATVDIFEEFIENMVTNISSEPTDPPAENGDEAIWGVNIGDSIRWAINDDTFAGTITSGGSSSSANWMPEIVVEAISESGHAVMVREQKAVTEYWYEDEARKTINIPYEAYAWRTIYNNGLTFTDSNDKQSMPLIYPLILNGRQLSELVDEAIENLPEKTVTDGADYYGVFGKTSDGMGFTPVETQWLDISVHKGTGIVSDYDWYYNNNDYGITARSQVVLDHVSFNLAERTPEAAIKNFGGSIYVEPNPVEAGTAVKITLELYDDEEKPVTDATVTGLLWDGAQAQFIEEDVGVYTLTFDTTGYNAGEYLGSVTAEKTGFETESGTFQFTVTSTEPEPPDAGIPASPIISIILGTIIGLYLTKQKIYNIK